jgi:adenosylcobinamide-GDP ribazoletransferase
MRAMLKNFITAVQFLTIFTLNKKHDAGENDLAKSMVYFPLVGFGLGFILVNADKGLLWMFPYAIVNAGLLVILVLLTRALHIDGLADTLDGLMGGYDSQSRLHIMKDSRIGTAGVLGIVLLLLVKYLALNNLFSNSKVEALLTAPLLARWSQTLMVYQANYGREEGMGSAFVGHLRGNSMIAAFAIALGLAIWVNGWIALYLVAGVLAFTLLGRWYLVKKLGGVTGDAIGAMSELNEVLVLLLLVVLSGSGAE